MGATDLGNHLLTLVANLGCLEGQFAILFLDGLFELLVQVQGLLLSECVVLLQLRVISFELGVLAVTCTDQ